MAHFSETNDIKTLFGDDIYEGECNLRCPLCGYFYSHRLHCDDAEAMYFEGECGHNWKIAFRQHKGVTIVTVEDVVDLVDNSHEMLP